MSSREDFPYTEEWYAARGIQKPKETPYKKDTRLKNEMDKQAKYLDHISEKGRDLYDALREAYEELKKMYKRRGYCPSEINSKITRALVNWEDESFESDKQPPTK